VIDKNILIEDLVTRLPRAVGYLMKKNIKCLACGEPIWGTLEDAARQKGFSDEEIDVFVRELNALAVQNGGRGPERD
jgi:methionine synthase II (cobalamin-independent)